VPGCTNGAIRHAVSANHHQDLKVVVHIARGALNAQVDGMQGLQSERGGSPAGPAGMIGSQGAERVKGAKTRSCSLSVLMEESAEQVASTHGAPVILGADGDRVRYAKLLLTTGSTPRRLPVPGAGLDRVLYLRRVTDSDRIKDAFRSASRVAVIGAGWIGLETAAAGRAAGVEVTMLERGELPLLRVLGREAAKVFADLHRDHAVDLRCGVQVAEITGSDGRASGVQLAGGRHIEADAVIVGVGVTPATQLAMEAGLEVDNGIRVDAQLRSSDPDIYAAGDVANAFHPCWASTSGSSTGPTRCTNRRPGPRRCSVRTWPTTGCRTSIPTSTTWAWSTPATSNPTATTRWSSAAMSPNASFSRSGWPVAACWPA
jgi:thioredoxin reductase